MNWSSLQLWMSTHVLSLMRHMKEPSVLMWFWGWWKTCCPKEQISKSSSHQLQWRSHCLKNISTRRLSKFQAECILSTLSIYLQKKKKWSRKSKKLSTNNCWQTGMSWKINTKDIFWCFVQIPAKSKLWLKYSRRNSIIMFSWWFHYMVNWVLKNRKKPSPKPKNTNLSLHPESQKQPSRLMELKLSLILDGTEKCNTTSKLSSHRWN